MTLCGVPVTWSSKLQTEIATSTMHSEYIALSTGMRKLLPVTETFNEICEALKLKRSENAKVVRAYEDNEGTLKLASAPLPKYTLKTEHRIFLLQDVRSFFCTFCTCRYCSITLHTYRIPLVPPSAVVSTVVTSG